MPGSTGHLPHLFPLQQPGLAGLGEHFGGVLGIELHQESAPVPLDGGEGEEEFVGNQLTGETLGDERKDVGFAVAEDGLLVLYNDYLSLSDRLLFFFLFLGDGSVYVLGDQLADSFVDDGIGPFFLPAEAPFPEEDGHDEGEDLQETGTLTVRFVAIWR